MFPFYFCVTARQQHAWYMTDALGTFADQVKQIQERIDWLMAAGFHFLSTESGFSEFTHPACTTMVAWMNATTQYTRSKYGRRTVIKAHISTVRTRVDTKPRNPYSPTHVLTFLLRIRVKCAPSMPIQRPEFLLATLTTSLTTQISSTSLFISKLSSIHPFQFFLVSSNAF